jgi:hypothetical protein
LLPSCQQPHAKHHIDTETHHLTCLQHGRPYQPKLFTWKGNDWRLNHKGPPDAVALWAFLHPDAAEEADKWVRNRAGWKDGFKGSERVLLTLGQLRQLMAYLEKEMRKAAGQQGSTAKGAAASKASMQHADAQPEPAAAQQDAAPAAAPAAVTQHPAAASSEPGAPVPEPEDIEGNKWLYLVWQRPGRCVEVPAGWMHQVSNLRPNIKLAYDVYRLEHFGQYIKSWRDVAARRTRGSNQRDYMACVHVLLTAAGLVADRFGREQLEQQAGLAVQK